MRRKQWKVYHVFLFRTNSVLITTALQQTIARMLFWGQQGVSPNIQEAVKHYERGALQWKDPVSMYDYGIILLQVRVTTEAQR